MTKTKHEFRKEIIDLGFKITDESTGELLNDDTPQPPLTDKEIDALLADICVGHVGVIDS